MPPFPGSNLGAAQFVLHHFTSPQNHSDSREILARDFGCLFPQDFLWNKAVLCRYDGDI